MKNNNMDRCPRIRFSWFRKSVLLLLLVSFFAFYGCTSTSITDANDPSIISASSFVEKEKEKDQSGQGSSLSHNITSEVVIFSETKDLREDDNSKSILESDSTSEDKGDFSPSLTTTLPLDTQATALESVNQVREVLYVEYEEIEHSNVENSLLEETFSSYPSLSSELFHDTRVPDDEADITRIGTVVGLKAHELDIDSHTIVGTSQIDYGKNVNDLGSSPRINESGLNQSFTAEMDAETVSVHAQALSPSTNKSNYATSPAKAITVIPFTVKEDHQLLLSREATTASLLSASDTEGTRKAPVDTSDPTDDRNERSISGMSAANPLQSNNQDVKEDHQLLLSREATTTSLLPASDTEGTRKAPEDASDPIEDRDERSISGMSTVNFLQANDQTVLDAIERGNQETFETTLPNPIQPFVSAVTASVLGVILLLILLLVFSRKKKRKKHINKPLYRESVALSKSIQSNAIDKTEQPKSIPDNRDIGEQESMYAVHIVEDERSLASYSIPTPSQSLTSSLGDVRWVLARKTIEVNGVQIGGGMLYVGSKVTGTVDPSFINTKLPVSDYSDNTVNSMGYWPSYSQISPNARGEYLAWLADGRKNPKADVGYVFLFFYGLERRVLVDYQEFGIDDAELLQIKSEVNRLFSIYASQSNSIKGYFSNFLSLLLLLERRHSKLYDWPIPENLKGYDLPFYLKAYLGQCAVDGRPIPAQAAYQWISYDPTVSKKTPARRCESELKQLFLLRYEEAFGDGLQLPLNKTKLKISYHAASSHLYGFLLNIDPYKDLPDVTVLTSISNKLKKIFDSCSDELDRYSRYLGKTGKELGNKKSLVFLPADLVVESRRDFLKTIHNQLLSNDSIPIEVSLLLKEILDDEMPTREALSALARVLEMDDISMEPDVLAYTYELRNENKVLLFTNNELVPKERDNSEYLLNVLMIELSYAVARADGVVDDKEMNSIQQYLDSLQQVSPYHMLRLRKHLEFLQHTPTNESSMKKKLKSIPSTDLSILLASVNNVVLADGIIDHAEIQFLERLYRYLELDHSELYHQLHNPKAYGTTEIEDTNRPLDYERVASLKIESAEVSSILSEIFLSDEEDDVYDDQPITIEDEEQENPFGLDDEQMEFLAGLVSKTSWSRGELQEMAEKHRIMLDGTLEHVNENSLELYGIPVTEGDDPLEILEEFRGRTVWQ